MDKMRGLCTANAVMPTDKLSDLKALAEMEYPENIREWGWCTHRRKILALIEVVELLHLYTLTQYSCDKDDAGAEECLKECSKLLENL